MQYKFQFTANKMAVILLIAYLAYDFAGKLTSWLYDKDVFLVMCYITTLWGLAFGPVLAYDWVVTKLEFWFRASDPHKYNQNDYIKYEEIKTRK